MRTGVRTESKRSEEPRRSYSQLRAVLGLLVLAAGVGFAVGGVLAADSISGNRYLEMGMGHLVAFTLRRIVNHVALRALLFTALLVLAFLMLRGLFRSIHATRAGSAGLAYLMTTSGLTLGLTTFLGYRLNRQPWFPVTFSLAGFLWNSLFALTFAGVALLIFWQVYRHRISLGRFLARLGTLRYVGVMALPFLLVNGIYGLQTYRLDREGTNLVLITVDTLRADHLGCYGYQRDTSPNIDRLAEDGTLFSQAVVQWPKTGPSFTSIMTSTYGYRHGLIRKGRQKVPLGFVLPAEALKEAGYRTAAVITNPNVGAAYRFHQGFDHYTEVWRSHPSQDAVHVTDPALRWLRRQGRGGKFFLWVHYVDPHARYEPPPPYDGYFVDDPYYDTSKTAPLGKGRGDDVGFIPGRSRIGDRTELGYYVAQYDAEIRYMDSEVGRLLAELDRLGLSESTAIVFTSDHGEALGAHNYYFEHGRMPYDDCVRAPLILRVPGLRAPSGSVDGVVELIDLYPTLLDVAGLPPSTELQGRSLLPLLSGPGDDTPRFAFTESGYQQDYQRVIRTDDWKLIYVPDADDRAIMQGTLFELYNISSDPDETVNLYDLEPEVAADLAARLGRWIEASGSRAAAATTEDLDIDEESLEALRALGYVD